MNISEALILSFIDQLKRADGVDNAAINQSKLLKLVLELKSHHGKYSYQELENISGIPHSTIHSKASLATERTL
jgi:hypothetical protein